MAYVERNPQFYILSDALAKSKWIWFILGQCRRRFGAGHVAHRSSWTRLTENSIPEQRPLSGAVDYSEAAGPPGKRTLTRFAPLVVNNPLSCAG